MYIREAKLDSFGKFNHKTISFSDGLNVVYGENESGKSTLHSFLVGMLFGLEKQRGRGRKTDGYQRYEPWNMAAYYTGSLEFAVTGSQAGIGEGFVPHGIAAEKDFMIERNFYHKEKSVRLYSLADGEELSVEHGDLDILLGDVGKRLYENTFCISQAAVVTEEDFAALLQQELACSVYGGDSGIDVGQAVRQLENRGKKEEQKLKKERIQKQERQERLAWEQETLLVDIHQLEQKLKELSDQENAAEQGETAGQEPPTLSSEKTPEGILWRIPVIGWILRLFRRIFRRKKADIPGKKIREKDSGAVDPAAAKKNLLAEQLQEKKTRLFNSKEEAEEQKAVSEDERVIQTELKSIRLAREILERVARESYQDRREDIQAAVSGIFSGITEGKYHSLEVTETGQVYIYHGSRRLEPWQLSRGALEQLYFALRLGIGRCLIQDEPLPVLLDETFCAYDDQRLMRTLRWLSGQQEQIILFTCQKREMELLEGMGAAYNKIIL